MLAPPEGLAPLPAGNPGSAHGIQNIFRHTEVIIITILMSENFRGIIGYFFPS